MFIAFLSLPLASVDRMRLQERVDAIDRTANPLLGDAVPAAPA